MSPSLQDQLTEIESKLAAEKQKADERNPVTVADLEAQQADILKAIMEQEQEAALQVRIAAQEEKIESEPVPYHMAGVDLSSLPSEFIDIMDKLTKIDRRNMAEDHNAEIAALNDKIREDGRAWAERELQLRRQNEALQSEIELVSADRDQAKERLEQLSLEVKHANAQRDAAMAELDGVKLELQTANEEIQQMRAAGHYGEANAQKIIDITPEETSEIQNLVNNLAKKLVSVNPIGGNWNEAVYDDGTKQVVHAVDVPKLEQVLPFQSTELDQTNVAQSTAVTPLEVADPDLQFPVQNEVQSGNTVDQGTPSTDGQGTVTRAEFETLVARVDRIERHANLSVVA